MNSVLQSARKTLKSAADREKQNREREVKWMGNYMGRGGRRELGREKETERGREGERIRKRGKKAN